MGSIARALRASLLIAAVFSSGRAEAQHHGRHGQREQSADPAAALRQNEARGHFQRGGQLYQDGDWEHAIAEFRQAHELWPNPVILFNLAQAYRRDGQLSQAIETFHRYVQENANLTRDQRSEVEEAVREIEENRAVLAFEVEPSGATVSLNGRELGVAPLARNAEVLPGEYRVRVAMPNHEARDETLTVRAHERRLVNIRLRPVDLNAQLVVNVSPADARIEINGEAAGSGHLTRPVRPGTYTVLIARDGYRDETQTVTVGALRTETVSVTMRPRTRSIVTRPVFWGVVGGVVAACVLTTVLVVLLNAEPTPLAGNGNPSVVQSVFSF